jgi:hypothetical protein
MTGCSLLGRLYGIVCIEICALLRYYTALSGSSVLTFRDNLLVPSSRVKKMGPIGCLETSVQNYHSALHNIPEERRSHSHHGGSLKSRMVCIDTQNFCNGFSCG